MIIKKKGGGSYKNKTSSFINLNNRLFSQHVQQQITSGIYRDREREREQKVMLKRDGQNLITKKIAYVI